MSSKRIAAECAFVDERGAVGMRLKRAAAIVRQYAEQFRAPNRKQAQRSPKPPRLLWTLVFLLFQCEAPVADSLHRVPRPV